MNSVILVNDLHYAYPPVEPGGEPVQVLKGVSLSLAAGECVALLGPTGAGKSTLCLCLNGIIPHLVGGSFSGEVVAAGIDTRDARPGELSQTVGLVFQDPESQLFTMRVADEVAFGPEGLALPADEIERRVSKSLDALGIAHLRDRSPLELSGGEQQRVALAAALALRPRVLVLDEPTVRLDPLGARSVLNAVSHLRDETGMSILWVTQDVDRVPLLADRAAVLVDGRIALEGTPREVFTHGRELANWGLRVPEMRRLAARFSQTWLADLTWLTVDEAQRALTEQLEDTLG